MTKADEKIAAAIAEGMSFLLDAGAGSGKTSSLVRALLVLKTQHHKALTANRQQVACITYTNVAKNEIIERTEHDDMFWVSTIHDFLWEQIEPFQTELKSALIEHNENLKNTSSKKQDQNELEAAIKAFDYIEYSDRGARFLEGHIHHDDVIAMAAIMFARHPLLPKLTGARFPFIFVDEYQDTAPEVVEILLDRIRKEAPETLVGFFGDKAQAIYDRVVGELSAEHHAMLEIIQKEENYRCAKAVIDVLNRFRTEIEQIPAGDNEDGAAVYVGVSPDIGPEEGYALAVPRLVDPPAFGDAKALFLTHKLIAQRAGYGDLHEAYRVHSGFTKDHFEKGEETAARCLAFEIDLLAQTWASGDVGETLRLLNKSGFKLKSLAHKGETATALTELADMIDQGRAIVDVVSHVEKHALLKLVDRLKDGLALAEKDEADVNEDEKRRWRLFRTLRDVSSDQLRAYRSFIDENTPYSTKHGVKGDEFDTVIVVVDDKGAAWTKYSFGKRFIGTDTSEDRLRRTGNLLYVCLSRARINLAVIDLGYDAIRHEGVEALFGAQNVIIP